MTELIQGQMSGMDAVAQAKFAAVYSAARDAQDLIDGMHGTDTVDFRAVWELPAKVMELLTKDPESGDE